MNVTVSIIVGVYNAASTLDASIKSIINQSFTDWELIICDDGSSDESYLKMIKFAQQDHRIRVIKNENNLGLGASLNKCLILVNGKYIARQDSDDISEPDRLEKQVAFLDQNSQYAMVGTWMTIFDETGEKGIIKTKEQPQKKDFIYGSPFCHATMMLRYDALKKANFYRVNQHTIRCEDYDLWMRMYALGLIGYNLPISFYKVRINYATYKRRKLKDKFSYMYVGWQGYKAMHMPLRYYPFLLRFLLVGLSPIWLQMIYHKRKFTKK